MFRVGGHRQDSSLAPQHSGLGRKRCPQASVEAPEGTKKNQELPFVGPKWPPRLSGCWGAPGPWQGKPEPILLRTGLD